MGYDQRLNHASAAVAARTFAERVRAGAISALDRFGRPLQVDQYVLAKLAQDPILQVREITPVVDPRLPAGQIAVTFTAILPMMFTAGQSVPSITIVGAKDANGFNAWIGEMDRALAAAANVGQPMAVAAPPSHADADDDDDDDDAGIAPPPDGPVLHVVPPPTDEDPDGA